jgi:hypothetical protein
MSMKYQAQVLSMLDAAQAGFRAGSRMRDSM